MHSTNQRLGRLFLPKSELGKTEDELHCRRLTRRIHGSVTRSDEQQPPQRPSRSRRCRGIYLLLLLAALAAFDVMAARVCVCAVKHQTPLRPPISSCPRKLPTLTHSHIHGHMSRFRPCLGSWSLTQPLQMPLTARASVLCRSQRLVLGSRQNMFKAKQPRQDRHGKQAAGTRLLLPSPCWCIKR